MNNVIYTKENTCQDCYKCIRHCPVKAIEIKNGHAQVIDEYCIACGTCVKVCPVSAKKIRNDSNKLETLLTQQDRTKILILAPSYLGEFGDFEDHVIISMFKRLGFNFVATAALGVQLLKKYYDNNSLINTSCPVIVDYISKYKPELKAICNKIMSPVHATARFLKHLHSDANITFVAPCAAKKRESDLIEEIDCCLTFDEFREFLQVKNIMPVYGDFNSQETFYPYDVDEEIFFPFDSYYDKNKSFNISGIEYVINELKKIDTNLNTRLELYSCFGGCVNGPTISKELSTIDKYRLAVKKRLQQKSEKIDRKHISYSEQKIENVLFNQTAIKEVKYSESEIKEVLISLEKRRSEDELNCSGCGYESCRDFAEAILDGKAEREMCLSYMKKIANNKANMLIKTMPAGVVIVNEEMKIIECNEKFAQLCGEDALYIYKEFKGLKGSLVDKFINISTYLKRVLENKSYSFSQDFKVKDKIFSGTFFCVEENKTACAVLIDITEPKFKKDEIIKRTENVIAENIKTVQQIAYLLGENAAQTESVLNSIIEVFKAKEIE